MNDHNHPQQQQLANTPNPPYYTVIFSSLKTQNDPQGYTTTASRMEELASKQEGYLGMESARDAGGMGITVSYWRDLEAIKGWKQHVEHLAAQEMGRMVWYEGYRVRVCKVERDYGMG